MNPSQFSSASLKMTEGSKNFNCSPPKTVSSVFSCHDPVKTTLTVKGDGGEASYQEKSQISYKDVQSGSYGRATKIDKTSSGDFCWKNGTSGVKNENTSSVTVRIGDQRGYTEVYREERVRDVIFDKNTESNTLEPCYYDGGSEVCGYDSDQESDPEPEPEPEPDPESEPEEDPESEPDLESEPEEDPESDWDSD